ncbi:DMT family transporter [Aquabacterium sp. A7-Y]|uniref:DMT family transporter n=1 Tax=Aquabacterium sp. A7-Y TaxID=1349605 RepID=UPI00223D4C94|nr:DMT family transporter [Aquabacterium sp. A7-Y]MCW7541900.1 DMT family transporter [Aquabacterium sp. A7-Y]
MTIIGNSRRTSAVVVKLLLVAAIFGINFPASKYAISYLGVWDFRLVSALAATLTLVFFFRRELGLLFGRKKDDLLKVSLLAVPNVFLVPTLNNYSLKFTSSSNSLILIYSMPIMVSVLTMIRERKFNRDSALAACIALAAIAWLLGFQGMGKGEVIIISSACVWAVGTFLTGFIKHDIPAVESTMLQFLVSLVLVLLFYFFFGRLSFADYKVQWLPLLVSIFVGVVGGAYVFILWFSLIALKGAEYVSYSSLLSLIFGVVFSSLVLNERLGWAVVTPLMLMAVSVWIVTTKKRSSP